MSATVFAAALAAYLFGAPVSTADIKCDAATIATMAARLPAMSNPDAKVLASAHLDAARDLFRSGDDTGCLAELDRAARNIGGTG